MDRNSQSQWIGIARNNPNSSGTNFLETQISAKSQGLKTVLLIYFNDFQKSGSKLLAVALTFQGVSFEHGNEIYWIWVIKRHVTFCWSPIGILRTLRRKLMFLRFRATRCRDNKGGWVLILFPPITPTKIPYTLFSDQFYVRFLEFSFFQFLHSFFSFLAQLRHGPGLASSPHTRTWS